MKNEVNQIKEVVSREISKFNAFDKKTRPIGCLKINSMTKEVQELGREIIYIAFRLGLIGNRNRQGSIIKNII
jgi:hypothetical protein